MNSITGQDQALVSAALQTMEDAWNDSDGVRFAEPFAGDGDQVNILGQLLAGRSQIVARHVEIFATIFAGSRSAFRLVDARYVSPNVILAHARSVVHVPAGPMAGKLETLGSLLFRKTATGWELVTFHNTRVAPDV